MTKLTTEQLVRKLSASFAASLTAYQTYLSNGKTYKYALVLKQYNLEVNELLQHHLLSLPVRLRPDALALIEHYNAWLEGWIDLEMQLTPGPNELFVFENSRTFPREAARRLEAELYGMKNP